MTELSLRAKSVLCASSNCFFADSFLIVCEVFSKNLSLIWAIYLAKKYIMISVNTTIGQTPNMIFVPGMMPAIKKAAVALRGSDKKRIYNVLSKSFY